MNPCAFAARQALSEFQITNIKNQLADASDIFKYASIGSLDDNESYLVISYETQSDLLYNEKERDESQESIQRCAIFMSKNNSITLVGKSGPLISYGPRDGVSCDLAWGSVQISHRNSSTLCSEFNETWKFKPINDQLVLIGYDSAYSDGCKSPIFSETASSINFLTKTAIHWRKSGDTIKPWTENSHWNKPFIITHTTKNKEIPIKFTLKKSFDFNLFTLKNFEAWIKKNENLCGYIDEKYNFITCNATENEQ